MKERLLIAHGLLFSAILLMVACSGTQKTAKEKGWVSLFDGKSLNGWKASERQDVFTVEGGSIKVAGPRAHLYYDGDVMQHNFKNFELKAKVMTMPGANSGFYFHTVYQDKGFPDKGFEVQVNNSHRDWKRTAGLYDIQDTRDVHVKDSTWFDLYIKVDGKNVTTKINDQTVIEWTEPENAEPPKGHPERLIDKGTFAIQAHDPKSVVFFKDIAVRPLP
jgi:hypothetical protein